MFTDRLFPPSVPHGPSRAARSHNQTVDTLITVPRHPLHIPYYTADGTSDGDWQIDLAIR